LFERSVEATRSDSASSAAAVSSGIFQPRGSARFQLEADPLAV